MEELRKQVRQEDLPPRDRRWWVGVGFLAVVFLTSAALTLDYDATIDEFENLGFSGRVVIPLTILKVLGVVTVLVGRYRTLTLFALAGFLFDLMLAFQANIAEGETNLVLTCVGLVAWTLAFTADRRRFGAPVARARHADQAPHAVDRGPARAGDLERARATALG